jgi:PQQ-like domain
MTLIDLGYADSDPVAASPRRAQLDRRLFRRAGAMVALLLCCTALTYSVRPRPHPLSRLWSLAAVGAPVSAVVGDSVLISGAPFNRTLSAYDLADGHRRWTHEMPEQVSWVQASRDSRVLLIATGERIVATQDTSTTFYTRTTAIDAATGTELWQAAGTGVDWPATSTALLQQYSADGVSVRVLQLVRLADGTVLWRRETPGARQLVPLGADPGHPDRVATVDDYGNVRVLRLADGAEVGSAQLEWEPGAPEEGKLTQLTAWGDALYVLQSRPHEAVATAYSDRTFKQLWKFETATNDNGVYPCGVVLCVDAGTGLTGYDWVTGRPRWTLPNKYFANGLSGGLLSVHNRNESQLLIDSTTGRTVLDLGDTTVVRSSDGDPWLTLGSSPSVPGRTVVRQFDAHTGTITLLGLIDAVGQWDCSTADRLLICSDDKGTLSVTALTAAG